MYALETRGHVDEAFKKLARKNPKQLEAVMEKIGEILKNPHRFKPLRFPLAGALPPEAACRTLGTDHNVASCRAPCGTA